MLLPQLDDGITLLDVEGEAAASRSYSRSCSTTSSYTTGPPFGRRKRARNDGNTRADLP